LNNQRGIKTVTFVTNEQTEFCK